MPRGFSLTQRLFSLRLDADGTGHCLWNTVSRRRRLFQGHEGATRDVDSYEGPETFARWRRSTSGHDLGGFYGTRVPFPDSSAHAILSAVDFGRISWSSSTHVADCRDQRA